MKADGMKIAAFFAVLLGLALAFALRGDNVSTNADYTAGENSQMLVTPELQAVARQMFGANGEALLRGVALTMQKYDTDMTTQTGRKGWHGRMVREEVSTNALCKIEVYSNEVTGAVWRYRLPFAPVRSASTRRKVSYSTNGVPARLAAARAARAAQLNGGTQTTNVVHAANGPDSSL